MEILPKLSNIFLLIIALCYFFLQLSTFFFFFHLKHAYVYVDWKEGKKASSGHEQKSIVTNPCILINWFSFQIYHEKYEDRVYKNLLSNYIQQFAFTLYHDEHSWVHTKQRFIVMKFSLVKPTHHQPRRRRKRTIKNLLKWTT